MAVRAAFLILCLLAAGAVAHRVGGDRVMSPGVPDLALIPTNPPGWVSQESRLSESVESVYGADTYTMRLYQRQDGAQVWLFVAYFRDQQVGAQIHSPKNCVPGGGWTVQEVRPETVSLPSGARDAQRMVLERQGTRQDLVYWFQTRSGTLSDEYALKLDLMKNSLMRRPTDAAFVRYHARAESMDAMEELMRDLDEPLQATLRSVGLP